MLTINKIMKTWQYKMSLKKVNALPLSNPTRVVEFSETVVMIKINQMMVENVANFHHQALMMMTVQNNEMNLRNYLQIMMMIMIQVSLQTPTDCLYATNSITTSTTIGNLWITKCKIRYTNTSTINSRTSASSNIDSNAA